MQTCFATDFVTAAYHGNFMTSSAGYPCDLHAGNASTNDHNMFGIGNFLWQPIGLMFFAYSGVIITSYSSIVYHCLPASVA